MEIHAENDWPSRAQWQPDADWYDAVHLGIEYRGRGDRRCGGQHGSLVQLPILWLLTRQAPTVGAWAGSGLAVLGDNDCAQLGAQRQTLASANRSRSALAQGRP